MRHHRGIAVQHGMDLIVVAVAEVPSNRVQHHIVLEELSRLAVLVQQVLGQRLHGATSDRVDLPLAKGAAC